jgi:DNA-binding CsgD family transcriptional regulator
VSSNPLDAIVFLRNLKKDPKLAGLSDKEEIIAHLRTLLDAFVETNLFGIFIYDVKRRRHMWVNKGYLAQGDYTQEEVVLRGKDFIDSVVHVGDFDAIHDSLVSEYPVDGVFRSHYRKKNRKGGWDMFYVVGQSVLELGNTSRLHLCFSVNLSHEGFIVNHWENMARENAIMRNRLMTDILTKREKEVLKSLAQGLTQKEVGALLNISFNTVHTHIKNLCTKLEKNSTAGLVAFAVDAGLN